jgi:hypothetical protein
MPASAPTPRCGSRCRPYPVWFVLAVPETIAASRENGKAICPASRLVSGRSAFRYRDFHQMSDDEVANLLGGALRPIERDRAWWMT